jgi:hypothetical protein
MYLLPRRGVKSECKKVGVSVAAVSPYHEWHL